MIHGKEYLLAILSEHGILRAETLRFADELRSPDDIGLPEHVKPDAHVVEQMLKAIQSNSAKTLNQERLADARAERILKRVEAKLAADEDVIHTPDDAGSDAPPRDTEPLDLMAELKHSLRQKKRQGGEKDKSSSRKAPSKKAHRNQADNRESSTERSRKELYKQAQRLDIAGRSKMSKDELITAIEAA